MNTKIRDLSDKTLDDHFSGTWSTMDYNDLNKFSEKFAELIVQECLSMMENCDGDLDFAIWNTKKHFGVEE